ncbi:TniQ family protein [Chromobacterium sp. TRC.1.1.SA]|uniref:TniQ family protein n=1 Tax=Chromobacterium indicum TaxID=3110228 RepID=A0ABV0CM85_9NEIS
MPHRLLLHPTALPEESVYGYCLRLSQVNGLRGLRGLHRYAASQQQMPNLTIITGHTAQALSHLRGPAPAWLEHQEAWEQGLTVTFWIKSHRRWCPQCLCEQPFWRAYWALALATACETHNALLIDICPSCRKHVPWTAGDLTHCQCGQDLRCIQTSSATPPALQSSHHLRRALNQTASTADSQSESTTLRDHSLLAAIHLGQLCSLLWFFGAYLYHPRAIKPQKITQHGSISVVLPLVTMSMSILEDWPHHFHAFIDRFSKPVQGCTASLRVHLGVIHQALFQLLKHPELHFLQIEFERYVHERWGEAFLYAEGLKHEHPMISGAEAAKILGVDIRYLKRLIAEGELQATGTTSSHGRKQLVVDRTSVLALKQYKGEEIPLRKAAKILRISPPRIRLLVKEGLLRPAYPGRGHLSKHLTLYGKDINTFLALLSHDECHQYAESTDLISVWRIGKQWLRGDENFLHLITALTRGELKAAGRDPDQFGIRALLLHRLEFRAWFDHLHAEQELMSIPDAARFLHIDDCTIYYFVQAGLLALDEHRLYRFGKHIPGLRRATLVDLQRQYLWGERLAQATGIDRLHAAANLIHQGAKPVAGPWIHKHCCYVFRKEDILKATTGPRLETSANGTH